MSTSPRILVLAVLAPAVAALACGGDDGGSGATAATTEATTSTTTEAATSSSTTGTSGDPSSTGEGTTTTTTAGGEPSVSYYRDVKPLLDHCCVKCHRAGDIAPFALESYEQASMWGPSLLPSLEDRTMPPWGADGACRDYRYDHTLSDAEIATITEWVDIGAPAGEPADEPAPLPDDGPPAIDYDIELMAPEPFAPTVYPDEYRCFLIDWPADDERFVTGFNILPGERSIVHHVIAFVIPPDEVDTYVALDEADPEIGYSCYGGPGGEAVPRAQWLGAWAPGFPGGPLPEGTGIEVAPGSKVAIQIHYHPVQGAGADQSRVQIRTATAVDHPAYVLPLANPLWMLNVVPMSIPAGNSDVRHTFEIDIPAAIDFLFPGSSFGLDGPVEVSTAGLHMHTLGTRGSLHVRRGGDEAQQECLVDVPRWDFNWQGTYEFSERVTVETSDTIFLECHFDNSNGDKNVAWGDGTEDEMCLGILYVSEP
ncbi:MAG: hypothetical protein R3A79_14330 [Nannocystaceae bacterium]